jgi:hypothetical protein
MWETWNDVFRKTLGRRRAQPGQRAARLAQPWAHQEPFSSDDADRALDSMAGC